jgi:hypothetical protein
MAIAIFERRMVRRGDLVDGARVFKNADTALHQHLSELKKARRTPYLVKLGQEGAHLRLDLGNDQARGNNPNPYTGDLGGFRGVGRLVAVCDTATEAYGWARTHFPSAAVKEHGGFHAALERERASAKPQVPKPAQPPRLDDPLENLLADAEHILQVVPQIILQGPPGTGKTYAAKRLTARLLNIDAAAVGQEESTATGEFHQARFSQERDGRCWQLVQFHPAYAYDDFVRGIQAETDNGAISYKVVSRVLDRLVRHHRDNITTVLIIDEINRANLAQVLGELIYTLEYRGSAVETPYEIEVKTPHEVKRIGTLQIPQKGFYIIGTMNTADRSIGRIDYAVRRRFAFLQLDPRREVIRRQNRIPQADKGWAERLFGCVGELFGAVAGENRGFLAEEFQRDDVQVGHTYFLGSRSDVKIKFAYQVCPLLREYCKDGVLLAQNGKIELRLPGDHTLDLAQPIDPENLLKMLD